MSGPALDLTDAPEQIERFPRIRDRALFMGAPEDIVAGSFGAGLPEIRSWTEAHFDFCGYPLAPGAGPAGVGEARALRAGLGIGPDEPLCVVSVGGSGVGSDLLRLVIEALPEARRLVARLRMVVVCGPGIDPASLPQSDGLHVLAYVHRLDRLLAAGDIAVVQGGLTTSMELAAAGRPFLYFPLAHHFEQRLHVRHRLERQRTGRAMEFEAETPQSLAQAIAGELGRSPAPAPLASDGAAQAARRIAELI
jgi:predicted glycosyltransferase